MPVILIEKDPFVEDVVSAGMAESNEPINVRRPLYGTTIKGEQFSHLSMRAIDSDGFVKPLVLNNTSAPGGESVKNSNYIVQGFSVAKQEKMQIIETFGDEYIFFYGERPTVVQVRGFLINTPDFNWRSEWYQNYDNYLRGTKCVERKARVYLYIDGMTFVGYIMNTATQITDAQPSLTPFSFSMLVTNYFDSNWKSPSSVRNKEEARGKEGILSTGDDSEYLSPSGSEENSFKTKYDLGTGGLDEYVNVGTPTAVQTQETVESIASAFWIGGAESGLRQFYEKDEAIREIAIREYMTKNNVPRFEAVDAFNKGLTIFSSAGNIAKDFENALGKGVQGSIVKV